MKSKEDLGIVFMGTPEFAETILLKLIEENYSIKGVVTAPDRPAGRGRKLQQSAVKKCAVSNQLPVLQPTSLKDESFLNELESLNADLFIVVAFRMLPKNVWQMPQLGTFNLHGSLLPAYRGAAPINWAIINGEKETGVTTFFIDEKIDTGEIILQDSMPIQENETAGELHDRMMHLGAKTVVKTIELIRKGNVQTQPQPDRNSKPAPKIFKSDGQLDFAKSIESIHQHILGMSPYPTAWIKIKHKNREETKTVKIFSSRISSHTKNEVVMLFEKEDHLFLTLSSGTLQLNSIQLEGKKRINAVDFLKGFQCKDWDVLQLQK